MEQFRECENEDEIVSLVMDKYQVDFNKLKVMWMIF